MTKISFSCCCMAASKLPDTSFSNKEKNTVGNGSGRTDVILLKSANRFVEKFIAPLQIGLHLHLIEAFINVFTIVLVRHLPSSLVLFASSLLSVSLFLTNYELYGISSTWRIACQALSFAINFVMITRWCYQSLRPKKWKIANLEYNDVMTMNYAMTYLLAMISFACLKIQFQYSSYFEIQEPYFFSLMLMLIGIYLGLTILPHQMTRRMHASAEKAVEEKRKLVRYISHEVRSPLTVIHAGLEMIRDEARQGGTIRNKDELLEDMFISSTSTVDFLNEMLMLENMESNRSYAFDMRLKRLSTFDLSCVDAVAVLASRANVSLSVRDEVESLFSNQVTGEEQRQHGDIEAGGATSIRPPTEIMMNKNGAELRELVIYADDKQLQRILKSLVSAAIHAAVKDSVVTVSSSLTPLPKTDRSIQRALDRSSSFERYSLVNWNVVKQKSIRCAPFGVLQIDIKAVTSNMQAFASFQAISMASLKGGGKEASNLTFWVAKNLMEYHGGSITHLSDPIDDHNYDTDKICTICLTLPVYKSPEDIINMSIKSMSHPKTSRFAVSRLVTRSLHKSPHTPAAPAIVPVSSKNGNIRSVLKNSFCKVSPMHTVSNADDSNNNDNDNHNNNDNTGSLLGVVVEPAYDQGAITNCNSDQIGSTPVRTAAPDGGLSIPLPLWFLLVDDSSMARRMIRRVVESVYPDAHIAEADDGTTAWETVQRVLAQQQQQQQQQQQDAQMTKHMFDIILLDNVMLKMNGPEFAAKVKQEFGDDAPLIIGVTGNGLVEDVDEFKRKGADDVTIKPLTKTTLSKTLVKFSSKLAC